jgi:hypothetical protein
MNKCISVSESNRPIEERYGHVYMYEIISIHIAFMWSEEAVMKTLY